ncbi:biotin/lipoyl-binding protein [Amycolatopsis rhizosphaerae]|uniref:Biotin/lipoyl-binding protein n=1 Tax=Amycolatopsis rhizosphaerae TaxID=2053003 RepID=A0A558BIW9_9PSEU|nr:biotin/lipoyl-binding protein [Amycolatopsis rhizosphaerae]TVT36463.1 biotin/lipoyl-binding protein [Amycolatopsis rhizosphaerae]
MLRRKRRWILGGAAVVVVAVTGVTIWLVTRPQSTAPAYRLVTVATTTLKQTVSSSGTIQPAQQSNLNFGVAGQVTAVEVTVGQQVSAGQTLATLQSASLSASVAQAKSTLASDQSKLSSDQTANASSAQLSADQAAITAAQNQLDSAQAALAQATMTSPIAGTVAAVNLTVGQQVSATGSGSGTSGNSASGNSSAGGTASSGGQSSSSSSSSSSAQIVVISTGSYLVNAGVDDTEVGQIKTGEQAVITPNGATTPVYGTVTSVGVMPSGSSSVPSYPVTIAVTGNPTGLFAGAGASVSIVVKQLTDVLAVPSAAVHYSGGQATVDELVGGRQTSKPITVGQTSNGMTQVLSGLSEGEQVMVSTPAGTGGPARTGTGTGTGNGQGGRGTGFGGGGRTGGLGGFGG